MRKAFEASAKVYEAAKKSIQEKWGTFKQKFEGTKSGLAQEVMKAESPDDLIALGEKLREQGAALKASERKIKQEESGEKEGYEAGKKEMLDADYNEGQEMDKRINQKKLGADMAKDEEDRISKEKKAALVEDSKADKDNSAAKAEAILAKLNGKGATETAAEGSKSSKELKEQYKALDNISGVRLGTSEYAQKVEELLQLAKEKGNYTQLEGQASEDAHNKMAEDLQKRLAANSVIMEALKRENPAPVKNTEPAAKEVVQEKVEDIYGMDLVKLEKLIKSRGYLPEQVQANDPNFKQKMDEFQAHNRNFRQSEVRLFDRVLSGKATEEEMKIAEDHATSLGKTFDLTGFHSAVPKAWYTNERIAKAIAETSPSNKSFVKYVKEYYPNETLRKQFVKIDDDGSVRTYEQK